MHTNGQRLLHQSSAARTHPGCVAWINQYHHTTSIFSFVRGVGDQLIPGCIRNAFCQTMILKHVLDPQIFKSHKAKAIHQFTAFLVSKVPAPIGNALMDILYGPTALCPVRSSFFCPRKFALRFGKFLFIPAKEPWIRRSSPLENVAKFSKPISIPTASSLKGKRSGSTSQEKQAYQFPTASF